MMNSKKKLLSSETLKERFGKASYIYSFVVSKFKTLWTKVENEKKHSAKI